MNQINTAVDGRQVYLAEDIMQMLGIGRSKTYEFLDATYRTQKPFKVIKVGKLVRVPKESFDKWLHQE